jgi:Sec-independent protein translocase protein TatA
MHGLNLGLGSFEILIVVVAALLLFGKELPQCFRSLRLFMLDLRDTLFRW